ncbi:MAG TPA: dihydropteroate synthase [Terriglobales bacterium]|jgi:dihydropteroate synthase|nr:dihydropteroate synthase [Terriglobales bacterium]
MRPVFEWSLGSRSLQLGKRTLVMGVVNVTPDSFSDGGAHFDCEHAVEHGLQMLQDGADIIDVGGESTRPGAKVLAPEMTSEKNSASTQLDSKKHPVSEKEELDRVIPVIAALKKKQPQAVISVDTYKASVAGAAVEAGAEIVNDVSGFRWDARMLKTLAELKCGVALMHMRGRPEEWRSLPPVSDIVVLVKRELRAWADAAQIAGVKRERIVLDPGFGFGKSFQENYPLLKRFDELHELRYPLLAGVSRKSFIGRALARDGKDAPVAERVYGTVAAETTLILKGAHIIRTHDVRACADAARIADVIVS